MPNVFPKCSVKRNSNVYDMQVEFKEISRLSSLSHIIILFANIMIYHY